MAARILQESLPSAIRSWSSSCGFAAEDCKRSLRSMFTRVREQVAIAGVQRRMVTDAAPAARTSATEASPAGRIFLRQRIPIDDVSAMLDALAEVEAESATERTWESVHGPAFALSL
jgi:hypothetical protein